MAPEVMEQAGGYDFHADIWSVGITALELAKGVAPYAHLSAMKVLVLTIEEPPPSLKEYPNDKQRDGAPFSSNFDDFYKKCLQKNSRLRPSTEELLKHKFLKNRSCYALVDQLLKRIPSVGQSSSVRPSAEELRRPLPGEGPVAIELFERRSGETDIESSYSTSPPQTQAEVEAGVDRGDRGDGTIGCTGSDSSSGKYSPLCSAHTPPPLSPVGRVKTVPPVLVSGTTWVFDGDDEQMSIGNSGDKPRMLRVSSRVFGRSNSSQSNIITTSSSSSSSTPRNDDCGHSNGIDSSLPDLEADAPTINSSYMSTPSGLVCIAIPPPPVAQSPPSLEQDVNNMISTAAVKHYETDNDNDAFMNEMEGNCNRDS